MSYTRTKTFQSGRPGLATVKYSLDEGNTWVTTGITESPANSGIYKASAVTFEDAFEGRILWSTGDVSPRYAAEDIAPAQIDTTQPVPLRNQDGVTAPTIGDSLHGAWAEPFAKETADTATKVYAKQLPDNSGPARTYSLTVDLNGNVTARS